MRRFVIVSLDEVASFIAVHQHSSLCALSAFLSSYLSLSLFPFIPTLSDAPPNAVVHI